jgi:general secretion pathway protein L
MNLLIVELKKHEVVFASFSSKRGEPIFIEATRHNLDDEETLPRLLAELVGKAGDERKVVLALPADRFFSRELSLPVSDRHKLRELLPLELKGETAVDADELVFDALPLAAGRVLAIWAKKRDLVEKIHLFTEAGLEPEIVTTSLFHWGALLPVGTAAGALAITDNEGLAVFQDGAPVCFRTLTSGDPQAEIARTLAALEITSGLQPATVYRHGSYNGGAATNEPPPFARLPMTGTYADTFGGDGVAAGDLAGAYAVAKACTAGEPLNLRTGPLAFTATRNKVRRKLRLTLALAIAFALLLLSESGVRYFLVRNDLHSLNNSIRAAYREIFPTRKKPVDEVAELRSEIKRLGGSRTSSSVLPVLKMLSEVKGEEISGIYEAELDGNDVRLKGDARSIQAVNDFKGRAAAFFTGAEVSEIKSRPDGSITFVFHGTYKEANK